MDREDLINFWVEQLGEEYRNKLEKFFSEEEMAKCDKLVRQLRGED